MLCAHRKATMLLQSACCTPQEHALAADPVTVRVNFTSKRLDRPPNFGNVDQAFHRVELL